MKQWQYKTLTISPQDGDNADVEIDRVIGSIEPDGWEYLSGPALDRRGANLDYVFFFRRPAPRKSAYEDGGGVVVL